MIKAIETRYKGYRFRSRLEARWAVFFDALQVEWDYEPEGFDLGSAGWYLPDFYLPDLDVWIEVKPVPLERNGTAWTKAEALATSTPILMLAGSIGAYDVTLFCHDMTDSSGGGPGDFPAEWGWSDRIGLCALVDGHRSDRELCDAQLRVLPWALNITNLPRIDPHLRIIRAVHAARAAQFEHGERP